MSGYKKGQEHTSSHWLKHQEKEKQEMRAWISDLQRKADEIREKQNNQELWGSAVYDAEDQLIPDIVDLEDEEGFIRLGSDFEGEHE